ncbi:hypothetical protein ABER61_28060 [Brevibacillus formosus]|uniref:Uncharacterized protein n=1 Tax=Brevibacillus formosus TaxID=54913 RepID=A0A837KLL0_9BACL|nr:hypothetical protein [Brevibacillus formosus]KLH98418.1 hypothetical protein AA984_15555 [Brevibacillus formosus]MED1960526.1 hypothetical protein [Brevibacillus formosus]PSJ89332.1 hypothetical protein C7R91_27580 [Brevibacillus formosus]GED61459.1 hypothetical protein BFO01nite_55910 [Brevibacillus formosus]
MTRVKVKYIKISSYLKLCVGAGVSIGGLDGVIRFLLLLVMGQFSASEALIFSLQVKGWTAGILHVLSVPLLYGLGALLFGFVSYFPFMYYLKYKKGLVIEGVFEGEHREDIPK